VRFELDIELVELGLHVKRTEIRASSDGKTDGRRVCRRSVETSAFGQMSRRAACRAIAVQLIKEAIVGVSWSRPVSMAIEGRIGRED
jgi:hypothetical protein